MPTVSPAALTKTHRLTLAAVLSALAAVLMFFDFPLPFLAPPFYKLDFSEVPILIGTYILGPVYGVLMELIKVVVRFLLKGTDTGGVGEVSNFIIGCALVVPAALIYKIKRTRTTALVGLLSGTVFMSLFAVALNAFVLLPIYAKAFHAPIQVFIDMGTAVVPAVHDLRTFCLLCVTPFNLFKGIAVSFLTFFLYKPIKKALRI